MGRLPMEYVIKYLRFIISIDRIKVDLEKTTVIN